ncbi:MAG TPA: DUF1631 family protein [Pseudomonadales bacterium]|nr:DUF1631 family protein [Pseudomonadales bacterium]
MSVESQLEQALEEGQFSAHAIAADGASMHETLLARISALQEKGLPEPEPLEFAVQVAAPIEMSRRDANTLYFCDQLFEQCQSQTDLDDELLAPFMQLRPLVAGVMLRDPTILQSFQHPLYQLLDQIWDAGRYWYPELGRQGEKYRARLVELLQKLRTADPVSTPFRAWLDELSGQLEKDNQRAETLSRRICESERGSLAGHHSERYVRKQLNEFLTQYPMPAAMEELIKGPLRSSLHLLFLSQGPNSAAWQNAIETTDMVLQSLQSPTNEEEKKRVYKLITQVRGLMGKQLISISNPEELAAWERKIESLHMGLLLDDKIEVRNAEPLPMIDEGTGFSANLSAALLEQVARIPEGQWLIYQKDNGETVRCRLAMKMEEAGQMLFVNVLGAKCLDKTLEEFAFLLADRHIRLLNADSNFSQILRDTVTHFLQLRQRQAMLQADNVARQQAEENRRREAQQKARMEAERIALERLAAQARAEEQARQMAEEAAARAREIARQAEEEARRAADDARRAAEEAIRAAEEVERYAAVEAAKRAQEEEAQKQAEAERLREHQALQVQQSQLKQLETTMQAVRTLCVGAWVELKVAGEMQKCKLAAVINASDKLIFVGRDGRKLAEPRRDELISMIMAGNAAIIQQGDQFESSLAKVIQTLRKD